eukprot:6943721-Prymnesium_polylepis.1
MPALRSGLVLVGLTMGTAAPPATWAAVVEAPEQPAPMIASTLSPLKAFWTKSSAAVRAYELSHLLSLNAKRSCVLGSRPSATPSVLLLISSIAWYTPNRGIAVPKRWLFKGNIASSTPSLTTVTRGGATCGGRLLSTVEK